MYAAISDRYAGFVRRDRAAFALKMADYSSDGAQGFLYKETEETIGYCVYYEKDGVRGEEVLSLGSYEPILHELQRISQARRVNAKLPPDVEAEGELLAQNVMLAPEDVWQAMEGSGRPWFCVDEY